MEFTVGERVRCCTGGELAGKMGKIVAISDRGMIEVECDMGGGYRKRHEFAAGAIEKVDPSLAEEPPSVAPPSGIDPGDPALNRPPMPTDGATENPEPPPIAEQPEPLPYPPLPPGTA